MPLNSSSVAYFSMEVALEPSIPTYSGGLGILAGDFLRSAADLGLPVVGITLIHRKGYFQQHLDSAGNQTETPAEWKPEEKIELMKPLVALSIEGRTVKIRAWRYLIEGANGSVPVYLLDADHPDNSPEDRALTDHLYGRGFALTGFARKSSSASAASRSCPARSCAHRRLSHERRPLGPAYARVDAPSSWRQALPGSYRCRIA